MAAFIEEVSGPVSPVGIDGCGAPVFATTARHMAQAFARLGSDPELAPIFEAMHAYPALVSGYGNVDAALATQLYAASKRGAAGCIGLALRGSYGLAVKVWDGDSATTGVALVAALEQLGVLPDSALHGLAPWGQPPVLGGGEPVGLIRSRLELIWS
jgi:L-asparaginase II